MNSRNQIVGTEGGRNQTKRKPEARHYSLSKRNRIRAQHTQETSAPKKQKAEAAKLSPNERRAARIARKHARKEVVQE